jgi:hypothetical protein
MMAPERLLNLLLQDSPRLLGEAFFHLKETKVWLRKRGARSLEEPDSPLLRFYRCIHAFKGMCGMMARGLPLAAELVPQFHLMEGRLAIKDNWSKVALWLPEVETSLVAIQQRIQQARQERELQRGQEGAEGALPASVRAVSGGRELVFPWESVIQFIPGDQVAGRPFVPIADRLVAVVPASGKAHEQVAFGIAVRTRTGQEIVVPVQTLEVAQIDSLSTLVSQAA